METLLLVAFIEPLRVVGIALPEMAAWLDTRSVRERAARADVIRLAWRVVPPPISVTRRSTVVEPVKVRPCCRRKIYRPV